MATIKIDRGFTQKIQAKGMCPSPRSLQQPPPKKPKGGPKWMFFAVAGGALALVVIIIAVTAAKRTKKTVPVAPVAQPAAVAQVPQQPAPTKPPAGVPVKPEEALMLGKQPSAPVPSSQPSQKDQYPQPQPRPIVREVPLGSPTGLLAEYYEGISDKYISSLRDSEKFPGKPSRTVQIGKFELSENVLDNYGVRVRGFLTPPMSGKYTFEIYVDDSAELWLSTDDTPANMRKLVTGITSQGKSWGSRKDQRSDACELEGGRRYYIEALMKEGTGLDFLVVGWSGPVSEKTVVIDAQYLTPWSDAKPQQVAKSWSDAQPQSVAPKTSSAVEERRKANAVREAALAPARAAVAEQQRVNGAVYRFAEAAQVLKDGKDTWGDPEARTIIEAAILRFELLNRLRVFLPVELARARLKGVWVAFGGQADVTGASDEGVTVAPGRIVAWEKVPPDQMLRLINATLPKAQSDATTKSMLFLAAAVFCKEISGGVDLAVKYRERAIALNRTLPPLADQVLGGPPEVIIAQPRIEAARAELDRLAETAEGLSEQIPQRRSDLKALVNGLLPGVNVEFWDDVTSRSLDEFRKQDIATSRPPDAAQRLDEFATPESRGEKYAAIVKGYLTPPETGDYVFYITADDQGEFWLSPDKDPGKAKLCIKTDIHTGRQQWDQDTRKSEPVRLDKGTRYFVKGLMREGQGGDHLAVAWSLASENKPALITSKNLLCEPVLGLPSAAQELQKKIEDEAQSAQSLSEEIVRMNEEEAALELAKVQATTLKVNELQKRVERAKEALDGAQKALQRIDAAMPQLKEALQAPSGINRK